MGLFPGSSSGDEHVHVCAQMEGRFGMSVRGFVSLCRWRSGRYVALRVCEQRGRDTTPGRAQVGGHRGGCRSSQSSEQEMCWGRGGVLVPCSREEEAQL